MKCIVISRLFLRAYFADGGGDSHFLLGVGLLLAFFVWAFSDLGQEFSGSCYVVLCPRMDGHVAGGKDFWDWEFARRD